MLQRVIIGVLLLSAFHKNAQFEFQFSREKQQTKGNLVDHSDIAEFVSTNLIGFLLNCCLDLELKISVKFYAR